MTSVLSISPKVSRADTTRPIWASVWVRKPAKTSCWRASMRRSSGEWSSQARTHWGRGGQLGAGRHDAVRHLPGEHAVAPGVPPLIEDAAVRIDPLLRDVMRGVHGTEREVQEEGLARGALLLVLHHADGLIGQVLAQVVALVGPARRVDVVVVADEVRASSDWCRPGGSRSSARIPGPAARCRRVRRQSGASAG